MEGEVMRTRGAAPAVFILAVTAVFAVCSTFAGASNETGAGSAPFVWTKEDAGTSINLRGVTAPDSNHCWAVGLNGRIYYTSNGGLDWTEQSKDKIPYDLYAVSAHDNKTAWATGQDGHIFKTSDGSSWVEKPKQPEVRSGVANVGSQHVWVAGYGKYDVHHSFDYSTDGGETWDDCGPITADHLTYYGISVIKSGDNYVGWAVGIDGYAQSLNDSNPSKWKKNYFSESDDVYGVSVVDAKHAWAVGENARIWRWAPPAGGGDPTWTTQAAPGGVANLRGVSAVSTSEAWAVGDNGVVIYTSDSGTTWTKQTVPGGVGGLYAVSAVDSNNVWAVGNNGIIIHGHLQPYISGCDPSSGAQGDEGDVIDITGVNTHFQTDESNAGFGSGIDVPHTSAVSFTEAEAEIDILADATVGGRYLQVNTGTEVAQSQSQVFQVRKAPPPPQAKITKCMPRAGQQWDEMHVVIEGENTQFTRGASTADFGDGIAVESTKVVTDEYAIAKIKIDGDATVGSRDVNIYTEGAQTPQALPNGYTVNAAEAPFINYCYPLKVVQGNKYTLTVTGRNTHFQQGLSQATFTGQGVEVQATNVTNVGLASVDIVVDADAELGPRDVNVVTPGLETPGVLPNGLTVLEPSVTQISPTDLVQGHVLNKLQIVGDGTHFADGLSRAVIQGGGVDIEGTTVSDPEHAMAVNVKVAKDAAPGARDVNVITGDETPGPLEGGLTIHQQPPQPPVLDDVEPGSGSVGTNVTLSGKYFGAAQGSSVVTFNGVPAKTFLSWSDHKVQCKVPLGASTGNVQVATPWGKSNSLFFSVEDFAFCFAEGTCRPDFAPYICIQNPQADSQAEVLITYMLGDGNTQQQELSVPANSRSTVTVTDTLGVGDDAAHDFSAKVECTNDLAIICERPMYFDYQGYASLNWTGGSDVVGEHDPSTNYYFAEGTCRPDFDPYITIQNPGPSSAAVKITYMLGDGTTREQNLNVVQHSRSTVKVADTLGVGDDPAHDFSAKVECTNGKEIIAERPMYFNYNGVWTGGHDVIGATSTAETFYFAEGTCRPDFDPYICIQNPGGTAAEVKLTYMLGDGTNRVEQVRVEPHSRSTVKVSDFLGVGDDVAHDFSTLVESTNNVDIVAERPMYFNYKGVWTGGHDVVGAFAPAEAFYFAEGTCRPDFDPYFCIQNPELAHAEVKITYMLGDGTTKEQKVAVGASSRVTVKVSDFLGVGDDVAHDFSAKVECTNGLEIIAERPMYFNYNGVWTGGHDVIGFTD